MQIKPRARRKVISVNTIHKIDSPLAICIITNMSQILIILMLGVFIAVLMRKKKHRPNRKFTPKPVSKSFSRNPNNKGKPKTSATIHHLKQPNEAEHPPIVGNCWVIDGDTIHIGSF